MSEWQPIETAPKDGTVIIGWHKGWDVPVSVKWATFYLNIRPQEGMEMWICLSEPGVSACQPPTHWMPLPDPPSGVNSTPEEP